MYAQSTSALAALLCVQIRLGGGRHRYTSFCAAGRGGVPHLLQHCAPGQWAAAKDAVPHVRQVLPRGMPVQVVPELRQVHVPPLPVPVAAWCSLNRVTWCPWLLEPSAWGRGAFLLLIGVAMIETPNKWKHSLGSWCVNCTMRQPSYQGHKPQSFAIPKLGLCFAVRGAPPPSRCPFPGK